MVVHSRAKGVSSRMSPSERNRGKRGIATVRNSSKAEVQREKTDRGESATCRQKRSKGKGRC